jgi:Protein of unknown function (DUF3168)
MSPGLSVQQAMRAALLARPALITLLGGAHVFDEVPRGANPPFVVFSALETRDWSVIDQKAHEHFLSLEVVTNARTRPLAQNICAEIELALDNAALTLTDHKLINLRVIFANVIKSISTSNYGAALRFRAATEPL